MFTAARLGPVVLIVLAACPDSDSPAPPDAPAVVDDCPEGAPTAPPRPASSGRNRVVYATGVDDRATLWMLDLDQPAADPVRLDAVGDAPGPLEMKQSPSLVGVWAPAGQRVAVQTGEFGDYRLGVIDIATPGTIRTLSSTTVIGIPEFDDARGVWSPDGDRLVFADHIGDTAWVVNVDGSGLVQVASGVGDLRGATFSPDGRYVGVEHFDPFDLYVSPADRNDPRRVAGYPHYWGEAGSQVLSHPRPRPWEALDVEANVAEDVPAIDAFGVMPVFSGDGAWLFASESSGLSMRRRGCGDPIPIADAPAAAFDARATPEGDHIVFAEGEARSSAWVADRTGDNWSARRLYTATLPVPQVDDPVTSTTGARAAWRIGGRSTNRFLVTGDGLSDPVVVYASGIVQPVGDYWFSPDLRRLAYLAGTPTEPTLRVLALDDPSSPVMLGELAVPGARAVRWVTWAPSGNAFGYSTEDSAPVFGLYVVRVTGGTLETPRLLGSTRGAPEVTFDWEP